MAPKQAIQSIHQKKVSQKRFPTFALETELLAMGYTLEQLNDLLSDTEIYKGKTLNQNYYELIENRTIEDTKWAIRLRKPKTIR